MRMKNSHIRRANRHQTVIQRAGRGVAGERSSQLRPVLVALSP